MRLKNRFAPSRFVLPLLILILTSALAAPAYAGFFEASDWTKEPTYLKKTEQKLGFGFLNLTAGWTALFFEPANGQNFFTGLGNGVLYFATDTLGGALHAVTFPISLDIPLPHGGIVHEYTK